MQDLEIYNLNIYLKIALQITFGFMFTRHYIARKHPSQIILLLQFRNNTKLHANKKTIDLIYSVELLVGYTASCLMLFLQQVLNDSRLINITYYSPGYSV